MFCLCLTLYRTNTNTRMHARTHAHTQTRTHTIREVSYYSGCLSLLIIFGLSGRVLARPRPVCKNILGESGNCHVTAHFVAQGVFSNTRLLLSVGESAVGNVFNQQRVAHSCFARFPTGASSRASAPLYPFTNKLATTGHTLKTRKSNEVSVCSHNLSYMSASFVEARPNTPVLHSQSVTHHQTSSSHQKTCPTPVWPPQQLE